MGVSSTDGEARRNKCLDAFDIDLAEACLSLSEVEDLVSRSEKVMQFLMLKYSVG